MKGRFHWVGSAEILEEYRRVLLELARGKVDVDVDRILETVSVNAEVVSAVVFTRPICSDPDDDKFLGTAIAAGAEYVVSGDKALLRVGSYQQIQVVSARQFLNQL